MLKRHAWIEPEADYHAIKEHFESNLASDAAQYNEFHALLVRSATFIAAKHPAATRAAIGLAAGGRNSGSLTFVAEQGGLGTVFVRSTLTRSAHHLRRQPMSKKNRVPKVVVILSGGLVQDVYSECDNEVIVLDFDQEGITPADVKDDKYLYRLPSSKGKKYASYGRAYPASTWHLNRLADEDCKAGIAHAYQTTLKYE